MSIAGPPTTRLKVDSTSLRLEKRISVLDGCVSGADDAMEKRCVGCPLRRVGRKTGEGAPTPKQDCCSVEQAEKRISELGRLVLPKFAGSFEAAVAAAIATFALPEIACSVGKIDASVVRRQLLEITLKPWFGPHGNKLIETLYFRMVKDESLQARIGAIAPLIFEITSREFELALNEVQPDEMPRKPRFAPNNTLPLETFLYSRVHRRLLGKAQAEFKKAVPKTDKIHPDLIPKDWRQDPEMAEPAPQAIPAEVDEFHAFYQKAITLILDAMIQESIILGLLMKAHIGTPTQNENFRMSREILNMFLRRDDYAVLLGLGPVFIDENQDKTQLLEFGGPSLVRLRIRPVVDRGMWRVIGVDCKDPNAFKKSTLPSALKRALKMSNSDNLGNEVALLYELVSKVFEARIKAREAIEDANKCLSVIITRASKRLDFKSSANSVSPLALYEKMKQDPWKHCHSTRIGGQESFDDMTKLFGILTQCETYEALEKAPPKRGRTPNIKQGKQ